VKRSPAKTAAAKPLNTSVHNASVSNGRRTAKEPADFRSTTWYKRAAQSLAIPVDRRNTH
jgi:hypothetical protein